LLKVEQAFTSIPVGTNFSVLFHKTRLQKVLGGMMHTMERKRAATKSVKSLDLPADLRAKALAFAASDSTAGNSLRDLIELNDDDDLKPAIMCFLEGEECW